MEEKTVDEQTGNILCRENDIVYLDTGESVSPEEFLCRELKANKQNVQELNNVAEKYNINFSAHLVKLQTGNDLRVYIRKDKDENNQKYLFRKIFDKWTRKLWEDAEMENKKIPKGKPKKFGIWEKAAIAEFLNLLYYPDNFLFITEPNNLKHPEVEDIAKMLDCTPGHVEKILRNLEDLQVIKRVKIGRNIVIYMNPFLYCAGREVKKEAYLLFRSSKYNDKISEI